VPQVRELLGIAQRTIVRHSGIAVDGQGSTSGILSAMSDTIPPKINRWAVFAEAMKSWDLTIRLVVLLVAASAPIALVSWLSR
jgi:hypothetical protein